MPLTKNNQPSKALLISPVGVDSNSAGSIFLRNLLDSAQGTHFIIKKIPVNRLHQYNPRDGAILRLLKSVFARVGFFQVLALRWYVRFQMPKDLVVVLREGKPGDELPILVTLSSPEAIMLASGLAEAGCKLYPLILDDPSYLSASLGLARTTADSIQSAFQKVLRRACSVAVISEAMSERYAQYCQKCPVVIRPGTVVPLSFPVRRGASPVFRLAFAGSLYAKQEWNSLIRALDHVDWRLDGKRVVIYFIGTFPKLGALSRRYVVKTGYCSPSDVSLILGKCHAAYLPYWLAPEKKLVASTSFPSKLATYMGCGLPVLHHGPAYTEAARLLNNTNAGVCCDKTEPDAVLNALRRLKVLSDSSNSLMAISMVLENHLSIRVMANRFADFFRR